MAVSMIRTKTEQMLADQFPVALPGLPGGPDFAERRKAAFALFAAAGLPTRRIEAWHYTDLRNRLSEIVLPVLRLNDEDRKAVSGIETPIPAVTSCNATFANGEALAPLATPEGVEAMDLRSALQSKHPLIQRVGEILPDSGHPMVALNTAFCTGGLVLRVKAGVEVAEPIQLSCLYPLTSARSVATRKVVVVEKGASVTLVETHGGLDDNAYQQNTVGEIIVEDGAKVQFIRVNAGGDASTVLATFGVRMGREATFEAFNLTIGSDLSRTEFHVAVAGEGSRLALHGVSLLRRSQHADTTLVVDHIAPGCESRELFRSVVDEAATGVFQGKIMVKREAQKTDGRMASNAILLSDEATMNNKPELEIFADDVQCAHGATCGALDDNLLFYLQARGLPKKEAEALMVQAFCGEAIEIVADEALREALNAKVADWLKARAG